MKSLLTLIMLSLSLGEIKGEISTEKGWKVLYGKGNSGPNQGIYIVHKTSKSLIIGGLFNRINCETPFEKETRFIAEWEDSIWTTMGSGINSEVNTICEGPDGNIYIGGEFSKVDGHNARMLAIWNYKEWKALEGFSFGRITALAADSIQVYAAGIFNDISGNEYNSIASFSKGKWHALGDGLKSLHYNPFSPPLAHIIALKIANEQLYVIGDFDQAGKVYARNIAMWNGKDWSAIGKGIPGFPKAMAILSNGDIIVSVMQEEGNILKQLPLFHWNGNKWDTISLPPMCQQINALEAIGNDLYIGGDFRLDEDNDDMGIAKLNGNSWESVDGGVLGTVNSLHYSDGTLYVAGQFRSIGYNHLPCSNIAGNVLYNPISLDSTMQYDSIKNLNIYPNPSSQQVISIDFQVEKEGLISIEIIDIKGRNVSNFGEAWYNKGRQTILWNYSKSLPSGQYTCIIHHGNSVYIDLITIIQ